MASDKRIAKILLIDNGKIDQIYLRRVLDQQRILYQMSSFQRWEEAISHFNKDVAKFEGGPDILLLYVDRNGANMAEVITQFRKETGYAKAKIFILLDSELDRNGMANMGVTGFIVNPLRLDNSDTISFLVDLMNINQQR
jgi:hypothetical protein